jgi:hypothetical protein
VGTNRRQMLLDLGASGRQVVPNHTIMLGALKEKLTVPRVPRGTSGGAGAAATNIAGKGGDGEVLVRH